ncbi:MAG: PadR family transcriptional regulator [Candidatus Marinimicrobia bacterium]|nr:PadR family transcriptional regulator [Candidatus Neomarinimicrobiota bacterium]
MTYIEIIILGIIKKEPTHAYDIEKKIDKLRLRERFQIGFSTIYNLLGKLERKKIIESKIVPQEKLPAKKIYHISENGDRILKDEIKKLLSQPKMDFAGVELGLIFSYVLDKREVKEALNIYIGELNRLIQDSFRMLTELESSNKIERILLNRRLAFWQTERKWVREVLTLL